MEAVKLNRNGKKIKFYVQTSSACSIHHVAEWPMLEKITVMLLFKPY